MSNDEKRVHSFGEPIFSDSNALGPFAHIVLATNLCLYDRVILHSPAEIGVLIARSFNTWREGVLSPRDLLILSTRACSSTQRPPLEFTFFDTFTSKQYRERRPSVAVVQDGVFDCELINTTSSVGSRAKVITDGRNLAADATLALYEDKTTWQYIRSIVANHEPRAGQQAWVLPKIVQRIFSGNYTPPDELARIQAPLLHHLGHLDEAALNIAFMVPNIDIAISQIGAIPWFLHGIMSELRDCIHRSKTYSPTLDSLSKLKPKPFTPSSQSDQLEKHYKPPPNASLLERIYAFRGSIEQQQLRLAIEEALQVARQSASDEYTMHAFIRDNTEEFRRSLYNPCIALETRQRLKKAIHQSHDDQRRILGAVFDNSSVGVLPLPRSHIEMVVSNVGLLIPARAAPTPSRQEEKQRETTLIHDPLSAIPSEEERSWVVRQKRKGRRLKPQWSRPQDVRRFLRNMQDYDVVFDEVGSRAFLFQQEKTFPKGKIAGMFHLVLTTDRHLSYRTIQEKLDVKKSGLHGPRQWIIDWLGKALGNRILPTGGVEGEVTIRHKEWSFLWIRENDTSSKLEKTIIGLGKEKQKEAIGNQ